MLTLWLSIAGLVITFVSMVVGILQYRRRDSMNSNGAHEKAKALKPPGTRGRLTTPAPALSSHEVGCTIARPKDGARVSHAVVVEGTISSIPHGMELWLVTEPVPGMFHPQHGPVAIKGTTFRGTAYVGNAAHGADTGRRVKIHLVLCSPVVGQVFNNYIIGAMSQDAWVGMPSLQGGTAVASVEVVRDDQAAAKDIMSEHVFAYGSNMCLGRFLAYGVRPDGAGQPGRLRDYRLTFSKRSTDRSGKGHVEPEPGDEVWGVLYTISEADLGRLDDGEKGYGRVKRKIVTGSEEIDAWVYTATPSPDASLRPYSWYKRFIVEGARAHGLPEEYVQRLEAIEAVEDPDRERDRRKRALSCNS